MKRLSAVLGRVLQNRWIAFVGAVIICYVSFRMVFELAFSMNSRMISGCHTGANE